MNDQKIALFVDDEGERDGQPGRIGEFAYELEVLGWRVVQIVDIDEAVGYIAAHRESLSLIILDIFMPRGICAELRELSRWQEPGLALYRYLRDQLRSELPVVLLTNIEEAGAPCAEDGFKTIVIDKAVIFNEFGERIRQWLERK